VLPGLHHQGVHGARDSPPFFCSFSCWFHSPLPQCSTKMSSTAAPADSWLSDFKDLLVPNATSSGSFDVATVPSLTASGSSGGPDGEFDGGAKRSHLFHFTPVLARSGSICLGVVGTGGRRFCIKKVGLCGAKSHVVMKFSPTMDTFYLKGNDTCAHTVPSLPA
jgi:hypothetical protein